MRKKRKNIKNQNSILPLPHKKSSFIKSFYGGIVFAVLIIVGLLLNF